MAKIILAVSGGVDSMAMLDFCGKVYNPEDLIVAHFDHNLRENSHEDLEFVRRVAQEKNLQFVSEKAPVGICKSENSAREKRYDFLRKVANENQAEIFTAHHLDDLAETVVINFIRGTGWRGLAVLDAPGIRRPFLETEHFFEPLDKAAILEYAAKRNLNFREDQTNFEPDFLRNRVRENMRLAFESKLEIYNLWQKQKNLKREIDAAITEILPKPGVKWLRKMFINLEKLTVENNDETYHKIALEILRAGTLRAEISATRPQLDDFYQAILNYAPGKNFNLPNDKLVKINRIDFEL